MTKLLRAYKTELKPNNFQIQKIRQSIGVSRFVYNFYIAYNKEIYEKEKRFISGIEFSKWLNNEFIPENPEYKWIKEVSSKSTKQSIMNADRAFREFFKGKKKFPRFKKKSKSGVKMYFVKTDDKSKIDCERHKIKIPTLGWVTIKEKGYLPTSNTIKSGSVSVKAGRYYVSVLVEEPDIVKPKLNDFGIGIDLGIKDFAICSNEKTYKNINKTKRVKDLVKKLKREQRKLSRKYESLKKENKETKGVATRQNTQKQVLKVQKAHQTINNIRTNYINTIVSELVKTKPSYITIEDLNVSGMMKNRHLSKAIAQQNFFSFRTKLTNKCNQYGIELRVVSRYYPSSKTCHECGNIKKDLKLSDREYVCTECGCIIDRDFNASLNLRDVKVYEVA